MQRVLGRKLWNGHRLSRASGRRGLHRISRGLYRHGGALPHEFLHLKMSGDRGPKPPGVQLVEDLVEIKERQQEVLETLKHVRDSYEDDIRFYRGIAINGSRSRTLDDPVDGPSHLWLSHLFVLVFGIGLGVVGTWLL